MRGVEEYASCHQQTNPALTDGRRLGIWCRVWVVFVIVVRLDDNPNVMTVCDDLFAQSSFLEASSVNDLRPLRQV